MTREKDEGGAMKDEPAQGNVSRLVVFEFVLELRFLCSFFILPIVP
jgi:hypothetical protein